MAWGVVPNRFPRLTVTEHPSWSSLLIDSGHRQHTLQSLLDSLAEPSPEDEKVRRETFEKYVKVQPWSSGGTEAQLYIKSYLKLNQATPREIMRAAAWLGIYDMPDHGQPRAEDQSED